MLRSLGTTLNTLALLTLRCWLLSNTLCDKADCVLLTVLHWCPYLLLCKRMLPNCGMGAVLERGVLQETYAYAKTLLDVATSNPDGRTRALLIGGGIANFTDVAATFKGIIQVNTARSFPHSVENSSA